MIKEQLPRHLGGHFNVCHIDKASLSFLKKKYDIKSMYDIGCGTGGMVQIADQMGIEAVGIDGDFTLKENLINRITVDFTHGPLVCKPMDLSWSCEFVEHIEEKFIDNYFSVFKQTRVVFITFCDREGVGHHHVNVKDQSYWDKQFLDRGFHKDVISTKEVRSISSMKRDFVRKTGTIYINENWRN